MIILRQSSETPVDFHIYWNCRRRNYDCRIYIQYDILDKIDRSQKSEVGSGDSWHPVPDLIIMNNIFKNVGIVSDGILNVSPREAFELVKKGALIVDVREDYLGSFKTLDIPELIYFPNSRLKDEFTNLPDDRYLIFADAVGLRSKEAVIFLKGRGFKKIANMAGGICDWERDGLPLKTDITREIIRFLYVSVETEGGEKKQKIKGVLHAMTCNRDN